MGVAQGLGVSGIDLGEFALVDLPQSNRKLAELQFKLLVAFAHAGFPFVIGFAERFAEDVSFGCLFVSDIRIHRR